MCEGGWVGQCVEWVGGSMCGVGGWVNVCVPTKLHECMPSTSSPGHPVNVTYAEPRGKDQQMQQAQHAQAWAQYYAQQGWLSAAAPAQQPTVGYQARAAGVNPTPPQPEPSSSGCSNRPRRWQCRQLPPCRPPEEPSTQHLTNQQCALLLQGRPHRGPHPVHLISKGSLPSLMHTP